MPGITFLHPDLGIGGAERLTVDAALALKKLGHRVNVITTHHDRTHAFEETLNGEIPVIVVGDWIPRSIFNRCHALMAYLRMVYAAFYISFFSALEPEVVFCDLVSVAVPILRLNNRKVIFYCHYPDQLLSKPGGILKTLYRAPLDWLEEVSMAKADHIFVNSRFTASIFRKTFSRIKVDLDILYPSLNMHFFDSFTKHSAPAGLGEVIKEDTVCFLSINRYERKKNLKLALEALCELRATISPDSWSKLHLIMAGGYDHRVIENVHHLEELKHICSEFKLTEKVTFLTSVSDAEKISLLKICTCLIYTPSNEHFGIVPVEAMYLGKPVIAANSGGPTESILDGETGFLCKPTPDGFAAAMEKFISDKSLSRQMGMAGRKRVTSMFSFDEFASKLNDTVDGLINKKLM